MEDSIDRLDIEINANTEKAVAGIDKLSQSLKTLSSSIPKINLGKSIEKVLGVMPKIRVDADTNSAMNAIGRMQKEIGSKKISIPISGELKGVTPSEYVENWGSVSTDIGSRLAELRDKFLEVGNTYKAPEGFKHIQTEISKVSQRLDSLYEKENKIISVQGIGGMKNIAFENLEYDISKLENQLYILEEAFENVGRKNKDVVAPQKFSSVSRYIEKTSEKANVLRSVLDKIRKIINDSSIPFGKMQFPLKKCFQGLDNPFSKLKNSRVTRAILYSVINKSITQIVNAIKTGLAEGAKNLTQYSVDFNKSISNMRSALGALRNSFVVAFRPIIEVVEPYITAFINKMVDAINVVGEFFSALTGKKFIKASKYYEDYASSIDKASKAIKNATLGIDELNIIGDDNGSSSGSGTISPEDMFEEGTISSWVNEWAEKFKQAWKVADFTEIGNAIGDKIKDALEQANTITLPKAQEFAGKLGKSIATGLNGLVETEGLGNEIGEAIANLFLTGIDFAYEFLTNFHFDSFGKFLGNTINGFLDKMGKVDATGKNGWQKIGANWANGIDGVVVAITNAVNTVNWDGVGQAIGNAIGEINWDEIVFDFLKLAKAIINAISTALTNWFKTDPLSATIVAGIGLAKLTGLKGKVLSRISTSLGGSLSGDKILLGAELAITVSLFMDDVESYIEAMGADNLWDAILYGTKEDKQSYANSKSSNPYNGNRDLYGEFAEQHGGKLNTMLGMLGSKEMRNEWNEFVKESTGNLEGLSSKLDLTNTSIKSLSPTLTEVGKATTEKTGDMSNSWSVFAQNNGKSLQDTKTNLDLANGKTSSLFETTKTATSNMSGLYGGLSSNVYRSLLSVNGSIGGTSTKTSDFKRATSRATSDISSLYGGLSSSLSSSLSSVNGSINNTSSKTSNLQLTSANASRNIQTAFNNISSNSKTALSSTNTNIQGVINKVENTNGSLKTLGGYTDKTFTVKASESGISSLKDSLSSLVEGLKSLFSFDGKSFSVKSDVSTTSSSKKADGGVFSAGSWKSITKYASGGTPNYGEMFIAREAGPELVGTIGGNTAVMNNDQIVESVSNGVARAVEMAMTPYLRQIATNTRETADKDFSFNVGDRDIARANIRGQRSMGLTLRTT